MDETMQAGKFKAECLKVMERVKKTRRKIIITKRNIPIAKLVPIDAEDEKIFGRLKGTVHFKQDDIIEPIEESWDADS
ncbi:MAG TPA: type II toxin-antitoxin system prevent-host-death family antitoxin [Candidatus Rhabdochlamydia sp.]|jgi:prevent-host-death family protein|nr:type II toxin-antitoxin system prevent-host-death family antitoxin [Candidatus Rhabdochlamydia sp.]